MATYEEYFKTISDFYRRYALSYSRETYNSFNFMVIRKMSKDYPKKYVDKFLNDTLNSAEKKIMELVDKGYLEASDNDHVDRYGCPDVGDYTISKKGSKYFSDLYAKTANDNYTMKGSYSNFIKYNVIDLMQKTYADAGRATNKLSYEEDTLFFKMEPREMERASINAIDGTKQVAKANNLINSTNNKIFNKKDKQNLLSEGLATISRLTAGHKNHNIFFKIFKYKAYKLETTTIENVKNMLVDKCGVKKDTLDQYQTAASNYVDNMKSNSTLEIEITSAGAKGIASVSIDATIDNLYNELKQNEPTLLETVQKFYGDRVIDNKQLQKINAIQDYSNKIPVSLDEKLFNNLFDNYYKAKNPAKDYLAEDIVNKLYEDYVPETIKKHNYENEMHIIRDEDYDEEMDDSFDLNESVLFDDGVIPDDSIKDFINQNTELNSFKTTTETLTFYEKPEHKAVGISKEDRPVDRVEVFFENDFKEDLEPVMEDDDEEISLHSEINLGNIK